MKPIVSPSQVLVRVLVKVMSEDGRGVSEDVRVVNVAALLATPTTTVTREVVTRREWQGGGGGGNRQQKTEFKGSKEI